VVTPATSRYYVKDLEKTLNESRMMPLVTTPRKTTMHSIARTLTAALLATGCAGPAVPAAGSVRVAPVAHHYWVYVGAESADLIHRVRFGPDGAVVEKNIVAGESPSELEGPHGLQISRDGRYLHMTTGHGSPDGKYWRYELGPDTLVGPGIHLGWFPASLDVTPDGLYAFVVNFNLHGAMVPSSVSVVYTPTSTEVARTSTCTMPHGSRVSPDGLWHYSTCMMDDQLVELNARTFAVSRRFSVARGNERPLPRLAGSDQDPERVHAAHGRMPAASCSPTWAQPSATGSHVYVACNRSDEVLEIDRERWEITRRFSTGRGPYNLAVTADGRLLLVTLKQGGGFQLFDLASGSSVMEEKSSTTLSHGVVVSPDSRYAFVTSEGVGAAPGKVDVWDLAARRLVATADVGQQASGIAFWRMAPVE
jgi:DNA-binding beta-propeller fold protein YncE